MGVIKIAPSCFRRYHSSLIISLGITIYVITHSLFKMTVAVDVGGTFTDFVIFDDEIYHFKIPSTPSNPSLAVTEGYPQEDSGEFFHGTTVTTNAMLEGKGVRTVFVTNKGFEDILFIARQDRPRLYDLYVKRQKPPLRPEDIYGIDCRSSAEGEILEDLDRSHVEGIAEDILKKESSAAVCLLHSYKDPELEEKVASILKSAGVHCSLSHKVAPEYREYERGITTFFDAYLRPIVKEYFNDLIEACGIEPYVMKSSGGLEKASTVNPIDTIFSGPAGGVAGGELISKITGIENLITFDMGGTSADMAVILDGKMSWKDHGEVGGFTILSRMVDIATVGAGGGSIAWIDSGGVLRVGPESARSEPGPVCYGRGGDKPTITDALLLAGYIDPEFFLGGKMDLDVTASRNILNNLSDDLGLPLDEVIMGIFRVANSKMARSMKKITVEKGMNPKEFSILAFGGAGPLHAAYLAELLGIKRVLIPPMPGVFSAVGLMTGDLIFDQSRTVLTSLEDKKTIEKTILELGEEMDDGEESVYLGLRYPGQSHHLNLPYGDDVEKRFHREHHRLYGHSNVNSSIEVVKVHVERRRKRDIGSLPVKIEEGEHPPKRECIFPEGVIETRVFYRQRLPLDFESEGPSVIEDINSTILVPPGWIFGVDQNGVVVVNK